MNIGVNCFGLRKPFYKDYEGALTKLKEIGVSSLEPCVFVQTEAENKANEAPKDENFDYMEARAAIWGYDDSIDKIEYLRSKGFQVSSVHMMCAFREAADLLLTVPAMKKLAAKCKIKYFVFSPSKTPKELLDFIPVFHEICDQLEPFGVRFVLHNHEAECQLEGDKTGVELVLEQCPKLAVQLDVGWATFAGRDCLQLMDRIRSQLVLIHLKDIREDASVETRDTCFTAIGEGSIPLKQIIAKAVEFGLNEDVFTIDQDNSDGDMLEDIALGVRNIQETVA